MTNVSQSNLLNVDTTVPIQASSPVISHELDTTLIPSKSIEDAIKLFSLYRDYIKHEDFNVNNRMTWFVQMQAFLITASAVVVGSAIQAAPGLYNPIATTAIAAAAHSKLAFGLVFLSATSAELAFSLIGFRSARSSQRFINAGTRASDNLRKVGNDHIRPWIERGLLPGLTDGSFSVANYPKIEAGPVTMLSDLPAMMSTLWVVVGVASLCAALCFAFFSGLSVWPLLHG